MSQTSTFDATSSASQPRRLGRSSWAVFAGFLAVVLLSLGTDEVLHLLQVYPPWDKPMFEPGLNLLALSYRIVYTIFGSYLTARLAPRNPIRHVWILAAIGFVVGTVGVIATLPMNLGPAWYPILLALSAWPCGWAGAALYRRWARGQAAA
jgi:hypothetical protein